MWQPLPFYGDDHKIQILLYAAVYCITDQGLRECDDSEGLGTDIHRQLLALALKDLCIQGLPGWYFVPLKPDHIGALPNPRFHPPPRAVNALFIQERSMPCTAEPLKTLYCMYARSIPVSLQLTVADFSLPGLLQNPYPS